MRSYDLEDVKKFFIEEMGATPALILLLVAQMTAYVEEYLDGFQFSSPEERSRTRVEVRHNAIVQAMKKQGLLDRFIAFADHS